MSIERLVRKQLHGPPRRSATRMSVAGVEDMISLAAGDPNFLLPEYIAEEMKKAVLEGCTHYCFGGDPELKAEVAKYYSKYGYKTDPSQVILTNGGSQSIYHSYAAILDEGDEVVAFDPAYSGGTMVPAYFGAKTVFAPLKKDETGFYDFDEEALKKAITKKTKAMYIENPGNPSGKVYGEKECKVIADLANDHDFVVVSDETYTEFIWTGEQHFPIITLPGMENRTIIAMALTKMFSWAGVRTGWVISGPELNDYVSRVPGSGISWPVQRAAIKALRDGYQFVLDMRAEYEERLDYGVKRLNELPGVKCPKPEGAFYLFPDITGTGMTSMEFTQKLMEEEHVRIIPGSSYGAGTGEGNVRLSMIRPLSTQKMSSWFEHKKGLMFEDAMDRIEAFVKRHVK
ncbi:MAG: pyridoxal phosphate-dependent aminotransferase [Candidatus Bathyarchaeota archaeon]|nr:pyridoxal phosphate-dependent aminotransferase [Candidatus Bathyarchaeota archaeon]